MVVLTSITHKICYLSPLAYDYDQFLNLKLANHIWGVKFSKTKWNRDILVGENGQLACFSSTWTLAVKLFLLGGVIIFWIITHCSFLCISLTCVSTPFLQVSSLRFSLSIVYITIIVDIGKILGDHKPHRNYVGRLVRHFVEYSQLNLFCLQLPQLKQFSSLRDAVVSYWWCSIKYQLRISWKLRHYWILLKNGEN